MHWILGQVPAKDRPTSTAGVACGNLRPPTFQNSKDTQKANSHRWDKTNSQNIDRSTEENQ